MENSQKQQIELSIIIKTLNEERNICRCIDAILDNLHDVFFEVIVADSGSTDKTVELASKYPVTIVQLANPSERSCGIGPQLGFQHSKGNFVLILDADMVLHADFVHTALSRMKLDKFCAGVGGQLVERSGSGYEYDLRRAMVVQQDEEVNWLDGGGLYRRDAILSVGYLSNRNLHAYEEKELGLRLRNEGWRLYRMAEVAADHYGHTVDTMKLLWRRWRSGYADACGESIRACFGKQYLWDMVLVHKTQLIFIAMQLSLLLSVALTPWSFFPLVIVGFLIALTLISQIVRKRGLRSGVYSLLYSNVFAIGLARGILRPQHNPLAPIQSVILRESGEPL